MISSVLQGGMLECEDGELLEDAIEPSNMSMKWDAQGTRAGTYTWSECLDGMFR